MSLREVAAAVDEAVDPTSLMQRVCERTLELIDAADVVAIALTDGRAITYVSWAGAGRSVVGTQVDTDSSLSGLAIKTGQILRSDDTQCDPRVDATACKRHAAISLVCIPLSRGTETYGVMAVNASRAHAFTDADVAVLSQLAEFVSVAVGSACDLDRVSQQLLNLSHRRPSAEEATGRYMMNVLSPNKVAHIDARNRIQEVLDDPDTLVIAFQPVIDLLSGKVVAVEALSRFAVTPARPPDAWFNEAHSVGRGQELEMLAINRALTHLPAIPEDIALSVNIGPSTVVGSHLETLFAHIPNGRVVLELTEHSSFDDYPGLPAALAKLRSTGLRLAVDDAGSGYSSLTHILKLAPDFIKLDREIITGIDLDPVRRALVTSLVTFAADTGAEIVAEGIETIDELHEVKRLGVRYAQGYYLGQPGQLESVSLEGTRPTRPLVRSFGSAQ